MLKFENNSYQEHINLAINNRKKKKSCNLLQKQGNYTVRGESCPKPALKFFEANYAVNLMDVL